MSDSYPTNLEIEIDRDRLRNYLQAKWLLTWVIVLGLFGMMFGLMGLTNSFEQEPFSWLRALVTSAIVFIICLISILLLAGVLYLVFIHRLAARFAKELRVSVEGPFLRVRQRLIVVADRKLHFRAIVDYTVAQDPLMRLFDIHALQMTTAGGGQAAMVTVHGVKDCLRARDILSEIDRLRENAP